MDTGQIIKYIVVPIISVVVFFLLLFLTWLAYKIHRKNSRDKIIKKHYERVSIDKLSPFNAEVSKVISISSANSKYLRLATTLREIFDELDNHYKAANAVINSINNLGVSSKKDKYHISKAEFQTKISEVESKIAEIETLEEKFRSISTQITQQDGFLNSEFAHFRLNVRKAIDVYQHKRILLDRISLKIDHLVEEIKSTENKFNELMLAGKMREAGEVLNSYSKQVRRFASIIDEGPQIQAYIEKNIPQMVTSLVKSVKQKKAELEGAFEIINFDDSIKEVAALFDHAKKSYENLQLGDAKMYIKRALKSIVALEKMINYEILSRNILFASAEQVLKEVRTALERYVDLKQQFRLQVEKGMQMPVEINDLFVSVKNLASDIDKRAVGFRDVISNKDIPYSAKLQRAKNMLYLVMEMTAKMNELVQLMWAINIKASLVRNKFKKVEAAVNEILANIKRQNIIISPKDRANLDNVISSMDEVSSEILSDNISKDTEDKVNLLVTNAIVLYKSLSTNIQIAEMTANAIREFAPHRALDQKINVALIQSEKLYLEGKYPEALNYLVNGIESGMH